MTDLPAGRELDAAVAERILGFTWRREDYPTHTWFVLAAPADWPNPARPLDKSRPSKVRDCTREEALTMPGRWWPIPHFSTDVAAAFTVLDRFMFWNLQRTAGVPWTPFIYSACVRLNGVTDDEHEGQASADTAPLAICQAALGALQALTPPTHPHTNPHTGTMQGDQGC